MVMKDEAMPKEIQGLIHHNHPVTQSETKYVEGLSHKCDKEDDDHQHQPLVNTQKLFIEEEIQTLPSVVARDIDYSPRPGTSSYLNGHLEATEKRFMKDFETRPNISACSIDKEKKKFTEDFEPRPNISAYDNDKEKKFAKDFEPRPNISAYDNDEEKKIVEDFEPRPNISAYGSDEEKKFVKDF
ncbi:hypothetical protein K1719_001239 [Acacia pycnantha]|nr:hypothetical protein K1719_001239 [Acacia pycnantha]